MSEHKDRRIFGTTPAQGQTTEKRNDSTGIQVTERRTGVSIVRVRKGDKMIENLVQMTESSIVPALESKRRSDFWRRSS